MTRGGGKAFVYTGPFVTGGGTPSALVNLRTWGTFSRASEASALIGAPTDGSTAFLRWYACGARRVENRGDGNGDMLLLEGARQNLLRSSRTFAYDWAAGSATIGNNYGPAPDGTTEADRLQVASGGTGANLSISGITPNIDWTGTIYRRAPTGTTSAQDLIGSSGVWTSYGTLSTTYVRAKMSAAPSNASTGIGMWVADGRNWVAFGGAAAGARDELVWGMQLEQASFPSSLIHNDQAQNTRAAEILSGPIGSVPATMINGTFSFDVAPIFSSAEGVRHATDQCIFSFAEDDSERILFVVSGGSIYIRVVSGGATKVTSNALTFSADQKLSVTINGAVGSIAVSGATTGNGTVTGTSWTRTTGSTMYVGSRQGGTQPLFARLGPLPTSTSSTAKVVLILLGQSNMQVNSITSKIWGAVQNTYPDTKKFEWAVGGTTLYSDWSKARGGATYTNFVNAWNAWAALDSSLSGYTPIIVWGQGETDSSSAGWSADYLNGLNALFTNIGTDIPYLSGAKHIIHKLFPTCGLDTSPGQTQAAAIRSAEVSYQAANPTICQLVETSDLATYDTIHYTDASTTTIVQRDAAIVRGWIG